MRRRFEVRRSTLFEISSVAVDTHVHRLANRLGMVRTTTHEKTADRLNEIVPDRHRQHAHEWLIQHGGKVCIARRPRCEDCLLADLCEYRAGHAAEDGPA